MTDGRLIASQAAGMALALGVGVLIGARACGTVAPPEEPRVETIVEERVVYECPPEVNSVDAGPRVDDAPAAAPVRPSSKETAKQELPDALPPRTPAERRRLFQWVSQQSRGLTDCAGGAANTMRTTVTLELDDDGKVSNVSIVDPSGEIDGTTTRCLRQRMKSWVPPGDLVDKRDRLIFGLVI